MRPSRRPILLAVLALAGGSAGARADETEPFVLYAFPAGGSRGTTVKVNVIGQNLQSATAVLVPGPGLVASIVSAQVLKAPPNRNSASIAANSSVTFSVAIARDADVGSHTLRLWTPGGLSNTFQFQVGQVAEVQEVEPNSTRGQAQALPPLPVVVNGQCTEGDRDFFKFSAKAGQTLVCRVDARSLIPYIADAVPGWNDPCLTLYDAAGHELASADDFRTQPDPVLLFRVPRDGAYTVEIHDVLLRGRGDFVYRLTIGELPYITDVFPLGGQRGTTTRVKLRGVNLPTLEADVPLGLHCAPVASVSIARDGIVSNTRAFGASHLASALEVEPNDTPATAMRLEPPVVIDGRIDKPGDVDCFVIQAHAGQKAVLEVHARRLGSPLDSILAIQDAKGKKLAENDDTPDPEAGLVTHQADSRLLVTFPATGDYVVRLRDVQGKGGPEYAYRLTITAQQPDFTLRVTPSNPHAARGDCAVLTVTAVRKDGFAQPIQVRVKGLPEGFAVSSAVIAPGQDRCTLTVSIPHDAPLGAVTPEIEGTAMVASKTVVHAALASEELTQSFSLKHLIAARELSLSVLEAGPYSLGLAKAVAEPVDVPQGGQVEVSVKVARRRPEKAAVFLRPLAPNPAVSVRGASIPADKDEAKVTIAAAPRAPVGSIQVVVITGMLRAGKDTFVRTLPAIAVRVTPAEPPKPAASQPVPQPASQPAAASKPAAAKKDP